MNHLTHQIDFLRTTFIEMMELVKEQLANATKALFEKDLELAEEIIRKEGRVNALELSMEKECENTIALFQPVATDLRLVISILKSISELERMGDHAEYTAKAIVESDKDANIEAIGDSFFLREMSDITREMFEIIIDGFENKNSKIVRQVFLKDKDLNKFFKESIVNFHAAIYGKKFKSEELLVFHSIAARMERSGDLLTNLAEEVIFYVEAEVLKHKKLKGKMKEKKS